MPGYHETQYLFYVWITLLILIILHTVDPIILNFPMSISEEIGKLVYLSLSRRKICDHDRLALTDLLAKFDRDRSNNVTSIR